MSIIKIDMSLYNNQKITHEFKELIAIQDNKCLKFNTNDIENTVMYDENNSCFIRENNEYRFELNIKPISKCTYLLKEENYFFNINVSSANIVKVNNKINLSYKIETDVNQIDIEINMKGILDER